MTAQVALLRGAAAATARAAWRRGALRSKLETESCHDALRAELAEEKARSAELESQRASCGGGEAIGTRRSRCL